MFVKVDVSQEEQVIEGFSYTDNEGDEETVRIGSTLESGIVITNSIGREVTIFGEDIPKLISALQAVLNHFATK